MKDFFAHPFWPFLGTIAALVTLWLEQHRRAGKLKLSMGARNVLKQLGGWMTAILAIIAFFIGNIIGQSGIIGVLGDSYSKFINILTGVITFFISIVLILAGNKMKNWMMKYGK